MIASSLRALLPVALSSKHEYEHCIHSLSLVTGLRAFDTIHRLQMTSETAQSQSPPDCPDHPFVSIITCTLAFGPSLQRCLDSLAAQDCRHFEILVVLNREGNGDLTCP